MLVAVFVVTAAAFHAPSAAPSLVLTRPRGLQPVAIVEADVDQMDAEAIALDGNDSFRPTRGPDGRLQPVLTLPGDSLETKPFMGAFTALSSLSLVGIVARAFLCSSNVVTPLASLFFGILFGELFSGTFHWATDNCTRPAASTLMLLRMLILVF